MTTLAQSPYAPDPAVIVASSSPGIRKQIVQNLLQSRISAAEAIGGADALGQLESTECQLLFLDRRLPDLDAEELLQIINRRFPGIDVLMLDDAGRPLLPSEWRSDGAQHLFETINRWEAPAPTARPRQTVVEPLPGMVGQAPCMHAMYHKVRLVAPRRTPVLITGASGTGKEMVAQAIHLLSPRANKEFVVINCAAIPEALLESELFGYVRGAFTGAVQSRIGRIHSAHGGTLFLDEIGELPLGMQAKLLRFLDQGEVQRLGSSDVFRVDVRVLAASNANLAELAQQKLFREDLFYRLSVFPIEMPPLAQRCDDVEELARHFLHKFEPENSSATLSRESVRLLEKHSWPGNVRELQHVIERASILAEGGPILPEHIGLPGCEVSQLAGPPAVIACEVDLICTGRDRQAPCRSGRQMLPSSQFVNSYGSPRPAGTLPVTPPSRPREVNHTMVGSSPALLAALEQARQAARSDADILLEAESGTGKELLARFIHQQGARAAKPFVAINCAAVPEHLLEAELFGHVRGAFTGALANHAGKFELASGGTLLLDEIGELPPLLQPKLLRVLQEREFYRLGDSRPKHVNVRIIASTNRPLQGLVSERRFREDLYYRLNVIPLTLPPLRERGEDVIELAEYFTAKFAAPEAPPAMSPSFRSALRSHHWPGNVRELANTIRRAVALCEGDEIHADILRLGPPPALGPAPWLKPGLSLREAEKALLEITLEATAGNRTRAAALLGVSLRTVRNKIREHGLPPRRLS